MQTLVAPARAGPPHVEHLVKIAIEDFALPAHAYRIPAHQASNSRGIKGVVQQGHVFAEQVVILQVGSEPSDRQVRDRIKLVKDDAEMRSQLSFVIRFQFLLRTRQEGAIRDRKSTRLNSS